MELTIEQALQQGVAAHDLGNLQEAERAYRAILRVYPDDSLTNHNLGLIAMSMNEVEAAIPLFKTALNQSPDIEQFWICYIDALTKCGQFSNAKKESKKAKKYGVNVKKLQKIVAQATTNLARKAPSQGQLSNLLEHYQNQRYNKAEESARMLCSQFPRHDFGWKILGAVLKETGRLTEVVTTLNMLIKIVPDDAEAYSNLGIVLKELGRLKEAENSCRRATFLRPDLAEAHNNLGNVLDELGRLDEAEESYRRAIGLKPDHALFHYNLGNILKESARLESAEVSFLQAIRLESRFAEAHSNLGVALQELGKLDEAESSCRQAIMLKPDYVEAYSNLGVTLHEHGKFDEAEISFNEAIKLKPEFAEAHHNLSFTLLHRGRLEQGLEEYEWRWELPENLSKYRYFSQPLWDGKESLQGKRILLWSEQGIGDTLNWASCLPLLADQAEHIVLECQGKLVPLLARSFPNVEIRSEDRSMDSQRKDFDFHLPMGSLYRHFAPDIGEKSNTGAYLIADPERVNFWRERLNSLGEGPYVGISWKSSEESSLRLKHYPPILEWSEVLSIPSITFVNLQYSNFSNDLALIKNDIGVIIHNFDELDQYNNVDDVVALCSALDAVVTTKVTPMIFASGVGTPTKIANWRQSTFNNILTNPVSSTLEMFDKDTEEPWDGVFNLIAEEVSKVKNRSDGIKDKKKRSKGLNKLNQNNVVQNPPQKAVDQLINYYNQGKISKVFEEAQFLIKKYPEAFFVWNILGVSAAQLGMLDKAIESYKKSIYFNSDYAEAYCNLGTALKDQGELEQAINSYNKAISLKPDYAEAYSNMGVTLQEQGNFVEAMKAYHQCISLKPTYDEAYLNMGVCFQLQGKLNEAIQAFKMSLLHNPNSAVAYMNLGNALKDQGKLDEALIFYNKSISLNPEYSEAYCNIGLTFHDQGKFDEAIEVYNKCISLTPNYPEVFVNKGNTLKDLDKPQEAI